MPGRLHSVTGPPGGPAIPHDSARDAVLDKRDAFLRHAFEVEGLRQAPRIQCIVAQRHLLVEDAFADATGEVAALLEQAETVERVPGEVLEELGDRVRLEHRAVAPGLELHRAARA